MNMIVNLLDRLPLDNKLLAVVLTAALTRAASYLGLLTTDPEVESAIALLAGALAGYFVPNEGSVMRRAGLEDGEPLLPPDEAVPNEDVPPGGEELV